MAVDKAFFDELEARIPKGKVRTRFAPSPTGYMHVGNLRTALYTWLIARHAGGTFILRIEDTDQGRLVEGATDVIYKTLAECGLNHDEGPDVGGPVGPYIQSERRPLYGKYAELLVEKGAAYRCFCEKDADEARQGFNAVFASGGVPDDAPCHTCAQGDDSTPPAFLEAAGLVKSRGEAKRLIKEGALSVDGQRCDDAMSPLAAGEYVIKLGKKRFLRLTVTA